MANCCNSNNNQNCGCGRHDHDYDYWYPPMIPGPSGPQGPRGLQGEPGGVLGFADFYALVPPDNAAPIAIGTDVEFPRTGAVSGGISRESDSAFVLGSEGTYLVLAQVSVTESGQLVLTLNGTELPATVVGRTGGTSQIVEIALVTTTEPDSVLTVRNPASGNTAITLTPSVGGTSPVSAHLVIVQLA